MSKNLKSPTHPTNLLFVGQIIRGKGVDLLIEIARKIKNPYHLSILGRGNMEKQVRKLIKKYRLQKQVEFVGWTLEVDKYYKQADILLVTSSWQEPFGLIGMEAFSSKKPVIGFDVGGISEWLHDRENGFLIPERNCSLFAEKIDYLIEHPKTAQKFAENGFKLVKEEYGKKKFLNKFNQLTDELKKGTPRMQRKLFVSGLAYDEGKSGISDYLNNVIKQLVKDHKVDLLMYEDDIPLFPVKDPNLTFLSLSTKLKKPLISMLWHLFILPIYIDFQKYDFIFLPAGNRRVMSFYPIPTIVTFHDLSQYHISGKYDSVRMFYIKNIVPFFVKKAHKIFAISESTKSDLVEYYKFTPDKISVNYNGFDKDRFFSESHDEKTTEFPLDLDKKYFLYISRIEHPGKNHLRLIKAYQKLPQKIKDEYDLVLPGKVWKGSKPVTDYVKKAKEKEQIHFLGFIDSEILPELYRKAALYIFPSLYEGFGIPLLEAMASSIPVICSNTSSLPEIGGDGVLTFDPENIHEITQTIIKVISDKKLQDKLIRQGLKQISKFDWNTHAENIISYYEDLD